MVYFRNELELRWLEGVIRWEVDVQEENTAREGGVIGTHDRCLPMEGISFVLGASRAVGGWVLAQIDEFFLDALECHILLRLLIMKIWLAF